MSIFREFAAKVVAEQDDNLLDEGPEVQTENVVKALEKVHARRSLFSYVTEINAFGFGTTQTCFATADAGPRDTYLQLFPLANAIGIPIANAAKLAESKRLFAIEDQRRHDEESGHLGWDYLNDWISLDLWLILDDPSANPDAGGRKWTHGSDWLVSLDRLTELVMLSPWGKEFMDNAQPMFSYAFKASGLEAKAGGVGSIVRRVAEDGTESWVPSGRTLADALAEDREGLTEDEARARAFRGPVLGDAA